MKGVVSINTDVVQNSMYVSFFWVSNTWNLDKRLKHNDHDEESDELPLACQGQVTTYKSAITLATICKHDLIVMPGGHIESLKALKRLLQTSTRNPRTRKEFPPEFIAEVMDLPCVCPREV